MDTQYVDFGIASEETKGSEITVPDSPPLSPLTHQDL